MRIQILFDGKEMLDTEVTSAEITQHRDVVALYQSENFKTNSKHIICEMVPSITGKICIDYLDDINMPVSHFYIASNISSKIENVKKVWARDSETKDENGKQT